MRTTSTGSKPTRDHWRLQFAEKQPELPRASRVTVQGQRSGNTIVVAAGGIKAAPGSTSSVAATGVKKVAVILFTFSDSEVQPYTPAFAQGVAFTNANSVAAYYGESSWGKLTLSGDVLGWYEIPAKSTSCDWSQWGSEAAAAAEAAGVDLGAYDYRVYAFPSVFACGWGGLSYLSGTESWLNGSRRDEPARHGARARPQPRDTSCKLLLVHRRRGPRLARGQRHELHLRRIR